MTHPRIYADFNGIQQSPRNPALEVVTLDTLGSVKDLATAGIRLHDGMRLVIHDQSDDDEDLEADVVVWFDHGAGVWLAEISADGYRYVPTRGQAPPRIALCVTCRAPLPPHPAVDWRPAEVCPGCGTPFAHPIAPPS